MYAPGTKYRPIAIAIAPHPALEIHDTIYPPPATYLFKPLNEEVLVYQSPFRLMIEITPLAELNARSRLTLKGQLTYQACDDKVCYLPEVVPFELTTRTP